MGSKLQTALNKIEEDYKMLPVLKANAADNPMVQQMEAERARRIAQARALYPSVEDNQTPTQTPSQNYAGFKLVN